MGKDKLSQYKIALDGVEKGVRTYYAKLLVDKFGNDPTTYGERSKIDYMLGAREMLDFVMWWLDQMREAGDGALGEYLMTKAIGEDTGLSIEEMLGVIENEHQENL